MPEISDAKVNELCDVMIRNFDRMETVANALTKLLDGQTVLMERMGEIHTMLREAS